MIFGAELTTEMYHQCFAKARGKSDIGTLHVVIYFYDPG